jgi:hypothetical protein
MSATEEGDQTGEQYSKIGKMYDLKALISTRASLQTNALFSKNILCLALATILQT